MSQDASVTAGDEWILATVLRYFPAKDRYTTPRHASNPSRLCLTLRACRYQVEDVEEEDGASSVVVGAKQYVLGPCNRPTLTLPLPPRKYMLPAAYVIPLATTDADAMASQVQGVVEDSLVLALFPGTTCLYPATVVSLPNKVLTHEVPYGSIHCNSTPLPHAICGIDGVNTKLCSGKRMKWRLSCGLRMMNG